MTPFGFEFAGTHLIVSEAGSNGVGSYIYAGGVIAPVAAPAAQFVVDRSPALLGARQPAPEGSMQQGVLDGFDPLT